VVIPCYNRGKYLEEAVNSVLMQEGAFELADIVIVDDHSDDASTLDALQRLGAHEVVRVLSNQGPRGPAATRNVGIRAATGDWIAFLDSDDVWLEGSLACFAEITASEPACQWLGADMDKWYEDGRRDSHGARLTGDLSGPILRRPNDNGCVRLRQPVEECICTNLTWTSTTMVKRALLLKIGGYNETLIKYEDGHLWVRLALNADLWFVPKVLALYRQHESSRHVRRYWQIPAFGRTVERSVIELHGFTGDKEGISGAGGSFSVPFGLMRVPSPLPFPKNRGGAAWQRV